MLTAGVPITSNELIDGRQLLNFVTLAETRSYTETARRLGLTQSAISHSIKALETTLGTPLFIRKGRKLELSQHGTRILEQAIGVLERMELIRQLCSEPIEA